MSRRPRAIANTGPRKARRSPQDLAALVILVVSMAILAVWGLWLWLDTP
jgi:hypothetical protein